MDPARSWVKYSLGGGHEISAAVLESSEFKDGTFQAVLPEGFESSQVPNFDSGGVVDQGVAETALARTFEGLAQRGAECVLVEDELAKRTDRAIARRSMPLAFVRDRVFSWHDLDPGSWDAAAERVGRVGRGYPTNAFVVSQSALALELADRRSMPDDFGREIARNVMAVVVAAFDGESYVIWTQSK